MDVIVPGILKIAAVQNGQYLLVLSEQVTSYFLLKEHVYTYSSSKVYWLTLNFLTLNELVCELFYMSHLPAPAICHAPQHFFQHVLLCDCTYQPYLMMQSIKGGRSRQVGMAMTGVWWYYYFVSTAAHPFYASAPICPHAVCGKRDIYIYTVFISENVKMYSFVFTSMTSPRCLYR